MENPAERASALPFWRPPAHSLPAGAWFGMTTREGGRSRGPYASFNVSLGVGDDAEAVAWNRATLRAALGYPGGTPPLLHQVHGAAIVRPEEAPAEADGFAVRRGDPWVAVSAADCAPVALVAADGGSGALLHSGWRGARAGIAARAVERLVAGGADARGIVAVVGPCLHACCFPVGADVAAEFDASVRRPHPSGQEAIDLPAAIRRSLLAAGVDAARVHVAAECTSCETGRFYSHRRDKGITGRHWAFLRLL
ncbi:MAG TPA: polyphenol oxidase family protein [Candidatus Eisenbacteria bacterium]|nr:polyphenol oxidase family protein [Candidatus Eisenbacteria bacterium]